MAKGKYQEWLEPDGLLLLTAWARDGLTDEQMAQKMGINVATLYRWKNEYSEICNALKTSKELVDIEVENSLLKNALGYHYVEQVVQSRKEVIYENGKRVKEVTEPEVIEVERWKPGESVAQFFWLKNRKPKNWRDKPPEDNDDIFAAIRMLVESNREVAKSVVQQETSRCDTKC